MIEGIFEFIIFISIIVVFASLVTYALILRLKVDKLTNHLTQEVIDKLAISSKLAELVSDSNSKNLEQTDGFIKFLSDSRDSAFKYIEEVQEELKLFMKVVGPIVEAYRAVPIKSKTYETLIAAYDRLIKIMPNDVEKK